MTVDYLFTAVCLAPRKFPYCSLTGNSAACLMFSHTTGKLDLNDVGMHDEIAASSLVRQLLGDCFVVLPYNTNTERRRWGGPSDPQEALIATSQIDGYLLRNYDNTAPLHATIVEGKETHRTTVMQLQRTCSLPERFVHSCAACPAFENTSIRGTCKLVEIHLRNTPLFNIEQYRNAVKYRHTKVGRFTAIGPSLTAKEHISAGPRVIPAHNFSLVEGNYEIRRGASRERSRRTQFAREVCSTCSMRKPCHDIHGDRGHKVCSYPYPDIATLANDILGSVTIPFTGPQLHTLLLNSGELHKRVDRRITFASFQMVNNVLTFSLLRRTNPSENITTTRYAEALAWLEKYNGFVTKAPSSPQMTAEHKATLVQMAATKYSPRFNRGWRSTIYPQISVEGIPGVYIGKFLWCSRRAQVLPWTTQVSTLQDYFSYYEHFRGPPYPQHRLSRNVRQW